MRFVLVSNVVVCVCLFEQGYVLVLGWVFNVVVTSGLSKVLC